MKNLGVIKEHYDCPYRKYIRCVGYSCFHSKMENKEEALCEDDGTENFLNNFPIWCHLDNCT